MQAARRQAKSNCGQTTRAQADPYRLLGISRSSSRADIRQAYLERMKQNHPDVSTDGDATEVAVQLNAAYQELMQVCSLHHFVALSAMLTGAVKDPGPTSI